MAVSLIRRRFTVGEYSRMADAGIFSEDDRVELIDGAVVDMVPIGAPHAGVIIRLNHLLSRVVGDRAMISPQNPVRLSDSSEPLPDVMLLRPRPDFYTSAHPRPGDVLLLVEVSDSSVDYDRSVKVPLYARHGVPEVWLVDLRQGLVEICRNPAPEGYREVRVARRGDRFTLSTLSDVALSVDDIPP